jgi:hypothetical protein
MMRLKTRYPTSTTGRYFRGSALSLHENPPTLHPCSPRKKGSSYRMSGADTAVNHAPLDASAFVAPRNLLARPTLSALDKEQIDGLVRHDGDTESMYRR